MTQKHTPCTDFHWIGETLMAKEFGETIELCNVDWSGLDEYEAEHKSLIAAAPELLEALEMARDSMAFAITEMTARGCVPFEDLELMRNRLEKMDAAIAKAKGVAK